MPIFDADCRAGVFWQQFHHWMPTAAMLDFSPVRKAIGLCSRWVFGWIPIIVWRGRSLSRRNTLGILRRKSNSVIVANWRALSQLALRSEALTGNIMQSILLMPDVHDSALRVEAPRLSKFVYHIKYKTARRHGVYLQREVDLANRIAKHRYIFSTQQGRGVAKEMMKRSLEFYDALGITAVRLKAGLSLGGVIWAKYGFRPIDRAQWEICKATIVGNRAALSRFVENEVALERHGTAIDEAVNSNNPCAIWGISAMDSNVYVDSGLSRRLGEALLMGSRWDGILDLTDRDVRYILSRRFGLR